MRHRSFIEGRSRNGRGVCAETHHVGLDSQLLKLGNEDSARLGSVVGDEDDLLVFDMSSIHVRK